MTNPLMTSTPRPPFSEIDIEHIQPALHQVLDGCRTALKDAVDRAQHTAPTWDSLVAPLEEQDDRLNNMWSPVSHLNAVKNTEALREAYTAGIAELTRYSTEVGQNHELYSAYEQLAESAEYQNLSLQQRKVVDNALRDFKLSGVALPGNKKRRFAEIKERLSELGTQFSNNILDATQGWSKFVTEGDLAGLPDNALALAKQTAEQRGEAGYALTLDMPSYLAVMMHAQSRNLREEVYRAYVSRASEIGPNAGEWDNSALIEETLALRHELAQLLGFENYAERSLATKMAESCDQVEAFLVELAEKSKPAAVKDYAELCNFAQSIDGLSELLAWDLAYYSEKLREQTYAISQEELKPYFPADTVVAGMFAVAQQLFGIDIDKVEADVWHEDVRFYQIKRAGQVIAEFYLDMFARDNKRGGAWMADCRVRRMRSVDGASELQLPVAFLTCNFTPPVGDTPSLLTHGEVTTLFHEFGHGLHHMLTEITAAAVSGITGVAWDAVELPSQFLENWCWEREVIPMISGHYETGEPLPESLLNSLLAAKNFQSAMQMVRQLEFSLFDFRLHRNYLSGESVDVQKVLDDVRHDVAVVIPPKFNRFQNSFGHIFAGGYAAGYYSYKWAEVLSSDAYSKFEEDGIFNAETGQQFLESILQRGGSEDAMALFKRFRGREPNTEALLRHSGIV